MLLLKNLHHAGSFCKTDKIISFSCNQDWDAWSMLKWRSLLSILQTKQLPKCNLFSNISFQLEDKILFAYKKILEILFIFTLQHDFWAETLRNVTTNFWGNLKRKLWRWMSVLLLPFYKLYSTCGQVIQIIKHTFSTVICDSGKLWQFHVCRIWWKSWHSCGDSKHLTVLRWTKSHLTARHPQRCSV